MITGFIAWLPSDQTAIIAGMKIVFFLALMAIVGALAMAGRAMLQRGPSAGQDAGHDADPTAPPDGRSRNRRMARALALRVALSIALFVFILISYQMGWIQPTGIPLNR